MFSLVLLQVEGVVTSARQADGVLQEKDQGVVTFSLLTIDLSKITTKDNIIIVWLVSALKPIKYGTP